MPSNIKNRTIPKYTSQTNSHKGYTIEELRRLFGEGKQITSENLTELINQCFNYELVSGEGIRIIELKNNNFKNNTTKTYKLECTVKGGGGGEGSGSGSGEGSGSGSGHCNVKADYGVAFGTEVGIADKDTIVADLYDYEFGGNPNQTGVYPVSLSEDGKLIVDMSTSSLTASVSAKYSVMKFSDSDSEGHFTFNIKISGSKVVVTGIRTVVDGVESTDYASIIQRLNNGTHEISWPANCSCRIDENNPNQKVVRRAQLFVDYTIKGAAQPQKQPSASTTFVHAIYYGYTCAYESTNPAEKHPSVKSSVTSQPCFKVYSSKPEVYDNERRTGIAVDKDNDGNYNVTIRNTENTFIYRLGYFDVYTGSQSNSHTAVAVSASNPITFALEGSTMGKTFATVILLPDGLGTLKKEEESYNGGNFYPMYDLEALSIASYIKETVKITDNTYYSDDRVLTLNYTAYTLNPPTKPGSLTRIDFKCTMQ